MARLRFPGRPGQRFSRFGVKYGYEGETKQLQDKNNLDKNIAGGGICFYELFGESDEVKFHNASLHVVMHATENAIQTCE